MISFLSLGLQAMGEGHVEEEGDVEVHSSIPALGRLRQEHKFQSHLGYIVRPFLRSKPTSTTETGQKHFEEILVKISPNLMEF